MTVNLSAAEIGVIIQALQNMKTEYDIRPTIEQLYSTVRLYLPSEYYQMWIDEFSLDDTLCALKN